MTLSKARKGTVVTLTVPSDRDSDQATAEVGQRTALPDDAAHPAVGKPRYTEMVEWCRQWLHASRDPDRASPPPVMNSPGPLPFFFGPPCIAAWS
jgi:hypothetical protein